MAGFRVRSDDDDERMARPAPALRSVSRSAPARPRWGRLYGVLITASALGGVAHILLDGSILRHLTDAGSALASMAVVAGWVHRNRIALARLDEPDAGVGKTSIRIVRSRARAKDDEYVHVPFDFR